MSTEASQIEAPIKPTTAAAKKGLSRLLILGYFLTLGVGCAQVYFLIAAVSGLNDTSSIGRFESIIIAFFFFFFSVFFMTRYVVTMLFAFMEGSKRLRFKQLHLADHPLVSVLIPAYNEELNIEATIESAVKSDYPNLEIIVTDDGSSDETYARALAYVESQGLTKVRVLTQDNGGKSEALNHAFKISTGEYVLCMDADSELCPDAITRLVARIHGTSTSAVAGLVQIKNTRNMITYLQELEYVMMNGTSRMFQSFFGAVLVAPGPITLFRRVSLDNTVAFRDDIGESSPDFVPGNGPWESEVFAEDAKLSMTLLASGQDCVFEPSAVCLTQAPRTLPILMNQRYRWIRGNLQALASAWDVWTQASDKRPNLGLWLAWFVVESVLWPVIDVFGAVIIVLVLTSSSAFVEGQAWYLVLILADMAAVLFAATACGTRRSIAVFIPFYRLGYGLLLEAIALLAMVDEYRKAKMVWN